MSTAPEDILQRIFDPLTGALRVDTGEGAELAKEATLAAVVTWMNDHGPALDDLVTELRTILLGNGREHRELMNVPDAYDPAKCKVTFTQPKYHVQINASHDVFWVDSAINDADAQTKLLTPNARGIVPGNKALLFAMNPPVTRLDFRASTTAAMVFMTAT